MNTETNEIIRGWLAYDAQCGFCVRWANRTHAALARRGFHPVPLQAPWVRARLGLKGDELPAEMKLLAPDGRISGGADALLDIARHIWWAWPVLAASFVPGVSPVLRFLYRRVARHRHCLGGRCAIPSAELKHHHRVSAFYEIP